MIKIHKVSAVASQDKLLNDICIEINKNELHAIIGPAGSGKTLLANLIAGDPSVIQTEGSILFNKKNINGIPTTERVKLGIFVSSQMPPSIDGVDNITLMKIILKNLGDKRTSLEIDRAYKKIIMELGLGSTHGHKIVNAPGSLPCEHLKNELVHMLMINPSFAVLDSVDDGLDPDDIDIIAKIINKFISYKNKACLLLTNNKTLMEKITPIKIHILVDGAICAHGDAELYKRIIDDDYSQLL